MPKGSLIATPSSEGGYSEPMTVAGRKGRFNWYVPPRYDPGIGEGRSPMYLFETEDGSSYFWRLESDKQGGRWEESGQRGEYDMMRKNPAFIYKMWGDSNVAARLMDAVRQGVAWEDLPDYLSDVNTWRQISGD